MTCNCRSYIDALSANVQRVYSKTRQVPHEQLQELMGVDSHREGVPQFKSPSPPSIALGAGIAGHRIAFFCEALQRI